jgi:pantoate kinase
MADTEYLTRELASLRISLGEVATRDFLKDQLEDIAQEIVGELRRDPKPDTKK